MRTLNALLAALAVFTAATPAAAQHIEAGVAVALTNPGSAVLDSSLRLIPIVRIAPKKGWGVAAGLNWFTVDLHATAAARGELHVRPFMAGAGYTFLTHRVFATASIVGGPSWNTLDRNGGSEHAAGVAIRPGGSVTVPIRARVSAIGFAGYLWNRATFPHAVQPGGTRRWHADALVASGGFVVRVF